MPAVNREGDQSTGHGCFPPTPNVAENCSTVFVNNKPLAVVGSQFATHSCGDTVHPQSGRTVTMGSGTVFAENKAVARIGDPISCGDAVGQGSPDTFCN